MAKGSLLSVPCAARSESAVGLSSTCLLHWPPLINLFWAQISLLPTACWSIPTHAALGTPQHCSRWSSQPPNRHFPPLLSPFPTSRNQPECCFPNFRRL